MDLPPVAYCRPRRLAEVARAIARPGACIYAGGTDLVVALGERRPWAQFVREIVDIKSLAPAKGIRMVGRRLRIGALATGDALGSSALVRRHAAAIAEAAEVTSAPALRQRGTVGGNIITPHPTGDVLTALLALEARVAVLEGTAVRHQLLATFIAEQPRTWPRQRLVLAVSVSPCRRSAFEKIGTRAAFSRSVVAVGVACVGDRAVVAIGGLRERPFVIRAPAVDVVRVVRAEATAAGRQRQHLAAVLVERALARVGGQ